MVDGIALKELFATYNCHMPDSIGDAAVRTSTSLVDLPHTRGKK